MEPAWLQDVLDWVQMNPNATGWLIFFVALGESLLLVGILLPGAAILVGLGTLIGFGVLDFKPEDIESKGRLKPGRMFLVDIEEGRIIEDDEIKDALATAAPYSEWLDAGLVRLKTCHHANTLFTRTLLLCVVNVHLVTPKKS